MTDQITEQPALAFPPESFPVVIDAGIQGGLKGTVNAEVETEAEDEDER